MAALLNELRTAHRQQFGTTDDLLVGLQLTHSGRFCRPNSKQLEPRIAYHHPLLDAKFGIDPRNDSIVWTDDDLERLIDAYVAAPGWRTRSASSLSTSRRATDTCCTSF